MLERLADRVAGFVADHDLLTVACLLVLTAGVAAGLPQLSVTE